MADSSKDLQLRELKDMITDLKKMIKTLQATVDAANKREEALMQERDKMKINFVLPVIHRWSRSEKSLSAVNWSLFLRK